MIIRKLIDALRRQDWIMAGVDFLIVIVGIFAALQVDQWQQDRADRTREAIALTAGREEIAGNVERLEQVMASVADSHAATEAFFVHAAGTPLDAEELDVLLGRMSTFATTAFSTGAVDALLVSGDLALVTDQALRQEIAGVKRRYAAIGQIEGYLRDAVEEKFVAALDSRMSRLRMHNVTARRRAFVPEVPLPADLRIDNRSMLEDRFVQNMAANMLFARPFHLQGGERLLDELALLSEHITAHLEAR